MKIHCHLGISLMVALMVGFCCTSGVFANGGSVLKIGVTEDRLYHVTYGDLTRAGFDLSGVDARTFNITNSQGEAIPILVDGEADGVFDSSDSILFYGTALTDRYTAENVYWLTAGGVAGQRMRIKNGALSGRATVPRHFSTTRHAERDSHYWQAMPNGKDQDHWFWDNKFSAPEARDYPLTLQHISTTASTATVRVRLKGLTAIPGRQPDHHTKIFLNDYEIDDQLWDGQIVFDHEVSVPHAYLNEGRNVVRVESLGDTQAKVDQLFVNWIEIDYSDTYVAEQNALQFGSPANGTFQFDVTGFRHNHIDVFDITDPANVMAIANPVIIENESTYTVQFEDSTQVETRYLARSRKQVSSPTTLAIDHLSSWKSPDNEADYIIITHEDFYDSALKLAAHRRASGLRVATVKVGDIYDEFNHGIFNPQAIQDFLSYAYHHWVTPAPTYVVLIGDAYQDYKDNLHTGTVNYVPSQIIETALLGETPSDNWFVQVDGEDILPDMFIGRLPVQTVEEMEAMVTKIINYERSPPGPSWDTNVLFVADDKTPSFEGTSDELARLLPSDYTANTVYVGDYPPGDPTKDIIQHMNAGNILVNYTGHGSVSTWGLWNGRNRIMDMSHLGSLGNIGKLPVMTMANCLNGFFVGRNTRSSLAEALLRLPEKGAVAVWAPTALNYPSGHRALMREFYKAVFQDGQTVLGAATTAAKIATYAQNSFWGELVETFVLFGDPAMRLHVRPRGS